MFDKDLIELTVNRFKDTAVLVIGDFSLDSRWTIDATHARLPTHLPFHKYPISEESLKSGMAGCIVEILNALDVGNIYTLGFLSDDPYGFILKGLLESFNANTDFMIENSEQKTTRYIYPRFKGYGNTSAEWNNFFVENEQTVSCEFVESMVLERLESCISKVDAVVVLDYMPIPNTGFVTDAVRNKICELAAFHPNKIFIVDSHTRINRYNDVIVKVSRFEAKHALDPKWKGGDVTISEARDCAIELAQQTKKPVYITLDEDGMLVHTALNSSHIPAVKLTGDIDPIGAGDSVAAVIALALSAMNPKTSANRRHTYQIEEDPHYISHKTHDQYLLAGYLSTLAASVICTKLGQTGTVTRDEIMERYI